MRHTKGPWHIHFGVLGDEFSIWSSMLEEPPICVRASLANAKLIAASPELFEASELMLKACMESKVSVSNIPEIAHALQFLKMAIEKARGEE